MPFCQDAAFDSMMPLDQLEIFAPVHPAIVKDQSGKKMLHHQVVQNDDPGMPLAQVPDGVMITRIIAHLVKSRVSLVDLAPGRTLQIVMANRRALRRLAFPFAVTRPNRDLS